MDEATARRIEKEMDAHARSMGWVTPEHERAMALLGEIGKGLKERQEIRMSETRVVTGIVKEKSELEKDFKILFESSFFQSDFPCILYVLPEAAAKIRVNQQYHLTLEMGALGKKKDGTAQDGSRPWHYRWKFLGFADGPAPAQAPSTAPSNSSCTPAQGSNAQEPAFDARNTSIERQVLAKEARISVEWLMESYRGASLEENKRAYLALFKEVLREYIRIFDAANTIPY